MLLILTTTSVAEWAIKYIQAEGSLVQERSTSPPVDPSMKATPGAGNAEDYGYYTAHHSDTTGHDKAGHLVISASSIRFMTNIARDTHFVLAYDEIQRLEKEDRIVSKNIPDKLKRDSGKDLRIVSETGQEWLLKNMDQRDEAFSQIVGFSKNDWQVLW